MSSQKKKTIFFILQEVYYNFLWQELLKCLPRFLKYPITGTSIYIINACLFFSQLDYTIIPNPSKNGQKLGPLGENFELSVLG